MALEPAAAAISKPEGIRPCGPWRTAAPRGGFTLIELMVVIAIIVLAAGLMAPTITDFFKNRQLESIRGQLGSAFNAARLRAVTQGSKTSLVFFKEGPLVYNERTKAFDEEYMQVANLENSALAKGDVWFVFGFLDGKGRVTNLDQPEYGKWEAVAKRRSEDRRAQGLGKNANERDVTGLPKIIFERDGSLTFASGADVSSAFFKESVPPLCDLMIYQANNQTVCFIDLRLPGQIRSKLVPTGKITPRPVTGAAQEGNGGSEGT